MVKVYTAVILLFLLAPVDMSFSQAGPGGVKIYSGYLHQYDIKNEASFWHELFGAKSSKKGEDGRDRHCSIEFKSPISFSHQSVDVLPEQLTYIVRFNNDPQSAEDNPSIPKDAFEKIIIKIYTVDDQEYTIDPEAEGKQIGINEEHHIFDQYLIYLILGTEIDHIEVASASGDEQYRYVLDKIEIRDNH